MGFCESVGCSLYHLGQIPLCIPAQEANGTRVKDSAMGFVSCPSSKDGQEWLPAQSRKMEVDQVGAGHGLKLADPQIKSNCWENIFPFKNYI